MKQTGFLILLAIAVSALLAACSDGEKAQVREVDNLPWQIDADQEDYTRVFSVNVGRDPLSDLARGLRRLPDLAFFKGKRREPVLEAWFSKVKLGVLYAGIVAEVDLSDVEISSFARFDQPGKPMPSGLRKYPLSKTGIEQASHLRVWKLTYLPKTDYSKDQLLKFFGKPQSREQISERVAYWYYPQKSLVVVYDNDGRELFHYSAKQDYQRLIDSLQVEVDG